MSRIFNLAGAIAAVLAFSIGFLTANAVRQTRSSIDITREMMSRVNAFETLTRKAQESQGKTHAAAVAALAAASSKMSSFGSKTVIGGSSAHNAAAIRVRQALADTRDAIDEQNVAYGVKLDDDLHRAQSLEDRLHRQLNATQDWPSALYDQSRGFAKWAGAAGIFTLLGFFGLMVLISIPSFRRIFGKAGTISAFGISVNLADLQTARASVQMQQGEVESGVRELYIRALRQAGLYIHFSKVIESLKQQFKDHGVQLDKLEFRATLFVPSFVGQELVQATRYVGNWQLGDETKVARRFSLRFGIIGKAARTHSCLYYPRVDNERNNLVRDWGFTAEEVRPIAAGRAGSLMAFCLMEAAGSPPLGVVYIEADGGDKLHPAGRLSIINPDETGVTDADRFAAQIWDGVDPRLKERLRGALGRMQDVIRWNDKIQPQEGR